MIRDYFNIHDIVRIQINKDSMGLYYNLNPEYEYFQVKSFNDPNIMVNLIKFKPKFKPEFLIKENYIIGKNYIYKSDSNYNLEIIGLEDLSPLIVNIDFHPKKLRRLYKALGGQNLFLRPLIQILLVKSGLGMLHSAGVSNNKDGFLLTGQSGVYKTNLTIHLINNGLKFLGDENIIFKDQIIYSYPFNIKPFIYRKDVIKDESVKGLYNKSKLLNFIRKRSKLNINIQNKVKVKRLYYIEKDQNLNAIKIEKISKDILFPKMIKNEKKEFNEAPTHFFSGVKNYDFQKLLEAYYLQNKNSKIRNFWEKYINLITKLLYSQIDTFIIKIPRYYNSKFGEILYKHIRGINRER